MFRCRFFIFSMLLFASLICNLNAFADATVDNLSPFTSQTGSWSVSSGTGPFDPSDPAANSLWARGGDDTFTWHFTPLDTGSYEVWEWHSGWSSRTSAAPHVITYSGGSANVSVNQQTDAGQWNSMGIYPFVAGESYLVTVTSVADSSSTCADAMRWTLVSTGNLPPTASIDSISPNPANDGEEVTFTGFGSDSDGSITAYQWRSSLDGDLSSSASFSSSSLSVGTHTISFEVQDNDGDWSVPVTRELTISGSTQEVIRDNGGPDTSQTGTWEISGGSGPFDPSDPAADSLWARGGDDTFSWHFTAHQTGNYEVWEWHSGWSSRTSAAPHVITHSGGSANVSVNQQTDAGQWNSMGVYPFVAGESYLVTVTSVADSSSTCADAMRWTLVSTGNNLPTASIDSIAPNPADDGETVTFTGSGSDSDGSIAAYQWRSSVDGDLSSSASFSTSTLSVGTHTITFAVQDNDGDWSVPVTQALVIQAIGANSPPTASIDSIASNPTYEGDTVTFAGLGSDLDGTIAAYLWSSSIDGNLSYSDMFAATTLSVGTHTITFTVQDDDGDWSDPVTEVLLVLDSNMPPTASIDVISPNPAFTGDSVAFEGSGSDTDGTISAYQWASNIDGDLGGNDSFSIAALSAGTHVITFMVQDEDGRWSVPVSETLTVLNTGPNAPPTAIIEGIDANPSSQGDTVTFIGSGRDIDGGPIVAYQWSSSLDGNLSSNDSFATDTLSMGSHIITFEVQDDGDWSSPVTQALIITGLSQEIIRDNKDPGTSQTGDWSVSGASNPYDPSDPAADSLWARGGDDTFTWYFDPAETGSYEVWEWHTGWLSRTSAAPHVITHADGETTVFVDQKENSGQWNSLGVFQFEAGQAYEVTVTSIADSSSTCADAVKWKLVPPANTPPLATIDTITPNPANDGEIVSFAGHGDDPEGSIVGYRWRSNYDGILSSSASFTTTTLSVGIHTISFEVQNDHGEWSTADTQQLDVDMVVNEVFPGANWKTATPDSQGVDSARLQQALTYFGANAGGIGTDEMVIVRNGYIIWKGTGADNLHPIFSGSKNFTTTLLGLLLRDGLIPSIDSKAVDYLPTLDDLYPEYNDVSFKLLATMTSGYDGINGDCWDLFQQGAYEEHEACVLTFTDPGPPMFAPGTAFKYHDPGVHLLGYLLTQTAGASLEEIFIDRIANNLAMGTSFTWTDYGTLDGLSGITWNNPAGTPGTNQGGVITTPEDLARFGLLYLNRGNWNGLQLLHDEWVDQALSNQVPASLEQQASYDFRGNYGYLWYTNDIAATGQRRWPSAPPKAATLIGVSRNYCFVIPEWNMVIARMSPYEAGAMPDLGDPAWETFFNLLKDGIY